MLFAYCQTHQPDLRCQRPGHRGAARDRDDALTRTRVAFNRPARARELRDASLPAESFKSAEFYSHITREITGSSRARSSLWPEPSGFVSGCCSLAVRLISRTRGASARGTGALRGTSRQPERKGTATTPHPDAGRVQLKTSSTHGARNARAREVRDESLPADSFRSSERSAEFCRDVGAKFCSMHITREISRTLEREGVPPRLNR